MTNRIHKHFYLVEQFKKKLWVKKRSIFIFDCANDRKEKRAINNILTNISKEIQ